MPRRRMAQATFEWLAASAFLNPTNVVFCDGLPGKLRQLAQEITCDPEPVILVDDQHTRLFQRMADLDEATAQLLKRSLFLCSLRSSLCCRAPSCPGCSLTIMERSKRYP